MAEHTFKALSGVSETLLMTLYARVSESKRPDAMIRDERAVGIAEKMDYVFSNLKLQRHDAVAVIARMSQFDRLARVFVENHAPATVVHIGCGLDTRFERVDDGRVTWFDLDLPDVIELRRQFIGGESGRYHLLGSSVFEDDWLGAVRMHPHSPILFMAEGVLPYFEEAQVKSLMIKLRDGFPGSELVCDAHNPFLIWADNLHLAMAGVKARMRWKLKHGRDVESWGAGLRLLEEWYYFEALEPQMRMYRWLRYFPGLDKSAGIFRYRLGDERRHP